MSLSATQAAQQMCDKLIQLDQPFHERIKAAGKILKQVPEAQHQELQDQLMQLLENQPDAIQTQFKRQFTVDYILTIVGRD